MEHIKSTVNKNPRILFASKSRRRELEDSIYQSASQHGIIVESYSGRIPYNWNGDGVIADYYSEEEILASGLSAQLPWVTHRENSLPNHACVKGDMRAIATMVVDYFQGRGFTDLASFERNIIDGSMEELERESTRRGLTFYPLQWQVSDPDYELISNFENFILMLGEFLRNLPKPCAVFAPNLKYVHPFYRACEQENIKVPQQLAFLCNNDDRAVTCVTDPSSSAIIGEIHETGNKMVESMLELISGLPVETKLIKPSTIVTRQSTDILAVPHPGAADAIAFLHRNHMNAISVEDAAAAAAISPGYMRQLFLKYLNRTPNELLREIRMNRAKELLKESYLTLNEIALHTGYGSGMAFSLAFKRENGLTPGEFRIAASAFRNRKGELLHPHVQNQDACAVLH